MSIFGNPVPASTGAGIRHGNGMGNRGAARPDGPTLDSPYGRTAGEKTWDRALDVVESPGVNYAITAGAIGYAGVVGGAAAAGTAAVGAAAGIAGGYLGFKAGEWLGDQVMPALGFQRIPAPGQRSAQLRLGRWSVWLSRPQSF
jgi:hypothetical protein